MASDCIANPRSKDGKTPYHYHDWVDAVVNDWPRRRCSRCSKLNPLEIPNAVRFWDHVNKNGPIPAARPELGQCWLYLGRKAWNGYGLWNYVENPTRTVGAHRYAWIITNGPIEPVKMEPDHLCKQRDCVRPSHMEIVTHEENMRRAKCLPFCMRGHPQTPENRYTPPGGGPKCLPCIRFRSQRAKDRKAGLTA